MNSGDAKARARALRLNILILLGYRNAVSVDTSLPLLAILELASNPDQTDGTAYGAAEVQEAVSELMEEELIRRVKTDFDSSELIEYATGLHPDHRFYITPMGILAVKRLLDAPEGDAGQEKE